MAAIKPLPGLMALVAIAIVISGCLGSGPQLDVEGVSGNDTFGLSQGCYSTISGTAQNNGGATATDVTVTCSTTQEGSIFGTKTENVGSLSAGKDRSFSMDVDTDCLKGEVGYDCTADCSNC